MKKNKLKRASMILFSLLLILSTVFVVACGKNESKVTLTLSKTQLSMQTGDREVLVAELENSEEDVVWTSSNTDVVTAVGGVVKAVGAGNATVTAEAAGKSAQCTVSVLLYTPEIVLSKESVSILITESETVTASVSSHGRSIAGVSVSWSTDNSNVATVEYGEITGVKAGTATVTATTSGLGEGKEISKTVAVTVADKTVSYKVNRMIVGGDGEWVKDGETESLSSVADTNSIMADLWSYKGMILNTNKSELTEGISVNDDGSTVLDLYYSKAVPVANSDGKGFIFYSADDYLLGHSLISYEDAGTFNGQENTTKISHGDTSGTYTTLVGVDKAYTDSKAYDRFSFNLYYDSAATSNIVININGVPASFHMSANMTSIKDHVKLYNMSGVEVANTTDAAWYKVVVDLANIKPRRVTGVPGFYIQLRCNKNASYYVSGATFYKQPEAVYSDYTVEYYLNDGEGNYVKQSDETVTDQGVAGETATADIKPFKGYFVNNTVAGTVMSGAITNDDALVLKLYYDVAIPIANSGDAAHFFALSSTEVSGSSGVSFEYVGDYQDKEDVYTFTQLTRRSMIRICGVNNTYTAANEYKTLTVNMYVATESLAAHNIVMDIRHDLFNGASKMFSAHVKSEVANAASIIKFLDADGNALETMVANQWVTVVVNLDGIESSGIMPRMNYEIGAEVGTVIHMQGATFSTDEF